MDAAKFFKKYTKPYCKEIKQAIELGKEKKIDIKFYPNFMLERAEGVLKECQGQLVVISCSFQRIRY